MDPAPGLGRFSFTPLAGRAAPAPADAAAASHARDPDDLLIELLDAVALGNAGALRTLYDLTAARMYGLALKVVRQPELAQDVLQEAFLTVWRAAADYRASLSPPLAWLGLVVRSRALDALRRRKAAREDVSEPFDDSRLGDDAAPLDRLASDAPGPQAMVQSSQMATALHGCLARLEPRQREVLSLAYLRELSHAELSQQLQLPLGTVKTWIRRGLDQLRVCMARFA